MRAPASTQLSAFLVLFSLSLALILGGALIGQPGARFHAADPAADGVLARFYEVERNERETFRWSQPLAALFLYGFEGRPALLSLRLASSRPEGSPPPELAIMAGEGAPVRFAVDRLWRRYHLLAPTRAAGETALRLSIDPYAAEGDPRELGVVLSDVATAGPRGPALPPLPRASFLLSLPLIGWLLALRLGAPPRAALAAGAALACVGGWAAAFPTPSGYWLPTLGWPWWPLLPLATLALARPLGAGLGVVRRRTEERPALTWAGLALALAALLAIRAGAPALPTAAAALGGVWLGAPLARRLRAAEAAPPSSAALALLGVLVIALFLRLYNLDGQPAGLWRDESRHGLQALRIWEDSSYRPVYVVEGADLPALLFYLMAPAVGLLGPHAWSLRLASALAGALTPLALYWAAGPLAGPRPALLGAALYGWASWSLSMSRWAFPATLDHLLVLTAAGLLWRGLSFAAEPGAGRGGAARGAALLALAGLLGGLAGYAYHTGRVAPLALATLAAVRLGTSAAAWRRAAPALAAAALAGLLALAPLLGYLLSDLEGYNRRVGAVSVFDSFELDTRTPLGLLLGNLADYALMWHLRGEQNGRHHLPGAPMLDPVAGLLLAVGLAAAVPAARRDRGLLALLLLWGVYFVPGVFSGGAPHAMRSLGTLAPACALAGVGLAGLVARAGRQGGTGAPRRLRPLALLAPALLLSLGFNAWIYFGVMRLDPGVYGEFDLAETAIGHAAQAGPAAGVAVYVPAKLTGADTLRFLAHRAPPRPFRAGDPIPGDAPALLLLPGDAPAPQQAAALAALGPAGAALGPLATVPGGAAPVALAFGRGEAARALVEQLR